MKRYLLLFICWLAVAGGAYMFCPAEEACEGGRERIDLLTECESELFRTVVGANCVADVSLQQSSSASVHFIGRRYPQFRMNGDRLVNFSGMLPRRLIALSRTVFGDSGDYHALQKQSGYYLYQLCRLII